jgi:DNA (cytosine-5)-methyltransferase 1
MKILDLFCGVGGASWGYHLAGCDDITGVDSNPYHARDYPFKFVCMDVLEFLATQDLSGVDFIHASPPCQRYSKSTAMFRAQGFIYPDLVEPVRIALQKTGKPYVIENVLQAPIRKDILLRGDMFGLPLLKKRAFECSFFIMQPGIPKKIGSVKAGDYAQVIGDGQFVSQNSSVRFKGAKETVLQTWREVMQIPFASKCTQLSEAIPPAYTQFIMGYYLEQYYYKKQAYENRCVL